MYIVTAWYLIAPHSKQNTHERVHIVCPPQTGANTTTPDADTSLEWASTKEKGMADILFADPTAAWGDVPSTATQEVSESY